MVHDRTGGISRTQNHTKVLAWKASTRPPPSHQSTASETDGTGLQVRLAGLVLKAVPSVRSRGMLRRFCTYWLSVMVWKSSKWKELEK